jgi:hypothetical protein
MADVLPNLQVSFCAVTLTVENSIKVAAKMSFEFFMVFLQC